jgi:hypothetical protein
MDSDDDQQRHHAGFPERRLDERNTDQHRIGVAAR